MMRRPLPTLAATLVVVIALAGPAIASGPPYTVTVGSFTSGTHDFTFASSGSVTLTVKSSSGTVVQALTCESVSGTGTATAGASVNPIFGITPTTWTKCTTVGGAATPAAAGPWSFSGTSSATPALETISGRLQPVKLSVSTTPSTVCTFSVEGSAASSFNESTQTLAINEPLSSGALTVKSKSGCAGQIQVGNAASLTASLKFTGSQIKAR